MKCTFSNLVIVSRMNGREAIRLSANIFAARSGVRRGFRACVLCSHCRVTSTEATSPLERHASSWSVATERGSREFLLRAPPARQRPVNDRESPKEAGTARYYMDTHAMVRKLEENGGQCGILTKDLVPLISCLSLSLFTSGLGYSRQQAECLVALLSTTLTTSLEPLVASQVSRKDIVSSLRIAVEEGTVCDWRRCVEWD